MKTYNFGDYFITTSEILEGYIDCFEVTDEQSTLIDDGANIEVIEGEIIISSNEDEI